MSNRLVDEASVGEARHEPVHERPDHCLRLERPAERGAALCEQALLTLTTEEAVRLNYAVAVDDWLFVVGGRTEVFNAPGMTTVFAGKLAPTGDITEWLQLAALPMPRTNHELAVVGDYLVLTGGAEMGPGDDTVWTTRARY